VDRPPSVPENGEKNTEKKADDRDLDVGFFQRSYPRICILASKEATYLGTLGTFKIGSWRRRVNGQLKCRGGGPINNYCGSFDARLKIFRPADR